MFCVRGIRRGWLLGLLWFGLSLSPAVGSTPAALHQAAERFKATSFDQTRAGVDILAASGTPQAVASLQALLEGALYQHKTQDTLVIVRDSGATEAATGAPITAPNLDELRKIPVNNSLRKYVRGRLNTLSLSHPEVDVRLKAAQNLLDSPDPELTSQLRELLGQETDAHVRTAFQLALALADLQATEPATRLAAIAALDGQLHPTVRSQLEPLATDAAPEVAQAAQAALYRIESQVAFYGYLETLFFGLSLGSVLVLAAIGLAITFGVMGVINMAHGELIMLGAYTTYLVQLLLPQWIDYSLFIAIPAAFLVSGFAGILIERGVIRHLYGRPLETLLATFGLSLMLQQLVRTVISPQNVPVANPSWMSGTLEINSVLALTYNRIYILLFCLLVFAALYWVLRNTSLGLQVRAVAQNRAMARAMGVRSAQVDALTFGLGSGIAGLAGVALSQLTNVGPNLGQAYIIDSFMVVVFGGVGNLWGTLVAGLSLGVVNKVLEPWAGAVLAKILVLVFIILFIQKRPRGLFPQKGRAAGD